MSGFVAFMLAACVLGAIGAIAFAFFLSVLTGSPYVNGGPCQ